MHFRTQLIAEQHNVLLTLHPGLAHFVWCVLVLSETELKYLSLGKWIILAALCFSRQFRSWCDHSLCKDFFKTVTSHILFSNNADQIVKENSFSLLFQNLIFAYVFILLSGMSNTTCNEVYKYTFLTMNTSQPAKHILN